MLKDKVILVFYVGTSSIQSGEVGKYLEMIRQHVGYLTEDDSVKVIFVPDNESCTIRIECINPVLLNEEQFKNAEAIYKRYKDAVDHFIKETENEEE